MPRIYSGLRNAGIDIFGIDNSVPVAEKDDIFGYRKNNSQIIVNSNVFGYTPKELDGFREYAERKSLDEAAEIKPAIPLVRRKDAFSIDALLKNGKEFYSNKKDSNGKYIGLAVALQKAIDEVGLEGIATMPYLIAGLSLADEDNYLRRKWHSALSEEYAGIDKNGRLAKKGEAVVIVMHGGGILTPDRILHACNCTYITTAKLSDQEFDGLLNGILPSGETINLYSVEDVKRGIPNPFGRYAVWMPAETAKSKSGYYPKGDFMGNKLVIARAGTLEYLNTYFDKVQYPQNKIVGNWHKYGEIDFNQPQGRVLFLGYGDGDGLFGTFDLDFLGRFVGVAPEAQGAKIP